MYIFLGLVAISEHLNGEGTILEPFPPGTYEEYTLLNNGTTKLLRKGVFHLPGDKPQFLPFVPYEGTNTLFLDTNITS